MGRRDDAGFSSFEFVVALALIAILVVAISMSLSGAAGNSVRASCANNVSLVDLAMASYTTEHPDVAQVTVAQLTATGSGTLTSWPTVADHEYSISIAGDGNTLVGMRDARGNVIQRNDVVVVVNGKFFDATRSFAGACASA